MLRAEVRFQNTFMGSNINIQGLQLWKSGHELAGQYIELHDTVFNGYIARE